MSKGVRTERGGLRQGGELRRGGELVRAGILARGRILVARRGLGGGLLARFLLAGGLPWSLGFCSSLVAPQASALDSPPPLAPLESRLAPATTSLESRAESPLESRLDSPLDSRASPQEVPTQQAGWQEAQQGRAYALFLLEYENDANVNSLVDKYYTAGTRLRFLSKELYDSRALWWLLGRVSIQGLRHRRFAPSFSLSLTQEIYAPKERFSPIPPPEDHPYGGYLAARFLGLARGEGLFEQVGLELGMVGRSAGAQEVQDLIHDLTHNARLAGWDTQLRNEFVLNAFYGVSRSIPSVLLSSGQRIDVMPQFSAALGNARIHAQVSLLARLGYRLLPNTAPSHINSGFVAPPSYEKGLQAYIYAGVGLRAVGRNIFLQGNSFAPHFVSEHRIAMLPLVAELVWGAVLEYRGLVVSYSVVHRSKEFATQDGLHSFGVIALGARF